MHSASTKPSQAMIRSKFITTIYLVPLQGALLRGAPNPRMAK